MGELKIVKLRFRGPLHLGSDVLGIGIEDSLSIAHSDTVFSCLINAYAELHSGDPDAVDNLLAPFHDGNPPFCISSAFPFQQRENNVRYYLPKPLVDPLAFYDSRRGQNARKNYGKLIRNLSLVSLEKFRAYWLGEGTQTRITKEELKEAYQEIRNLYVPTIRPQHTRDRLTDATSIYHTGLVYFAPNSGLYFLIEIKDTSILSWDEFRAVLDLAGANGLGGRRSHGNGAFDIKEDTIETLDQTWQVLLNQKQNGFVNLSLYRPKPKTLKSLNPIAYQLVPRRGWCYSSVTPTQTKRKAVTMFGEGSVFCNKNAPRGMLANVTPDSGFEAHELYRYGIPIALPIKILEMEDRRE
ncbi:MAG: type III-A CRISPR-associated RAMP protein Csm4 [Candidatus Poribacteria bacterium]|nr:type III-A CRISPR-associated RAMP protein Csm4 [Candidatus Poribacteria bacterium]